MVRDFLDSLPHDAGFVRKERWPPAGGDVGIMVDGGRENRSPVLGVPARIICASSEEGNSVRRSGNYHLIFQYGCL